jgi:hypothetical protein
MEVGMLDRRHARRDWLKLMVGTGGGALLLSALPGCAFPANDGAAFEPWNFPGEETRPEFIVARAALLAANPHDTQPWALRVTPSLIELHADFSRNLGTMDSLLREMHIGLGCALRNMLIAAGAVSLTPTVTLLPDANDSSLVASIALAAGPKLHDALFDHISQRHTNRGRYADAPVAQALPSALSALVTEPGIELTLLTSDTDKASFRAGTIQATEAIIADAEMSRDDNAWYRHTAQDILEHRDGITLDCAGQGAATTYFGKLGSRPSDATANDYWLASTKGNQTTGSAFGILSSSADNTRADQLRTGLVYQHIHLWAVSQGLAMQPLNQLPERQDREETQSLPPVATSVLESLMGASDRRAQMLFRIGYAWDSANESPRRPIEWVLL